MSNNKAQHTSSDFNMERISTPELAEHVAATIQLGGNIAVIGRRGTGKTEIAKQQIVAADMDEVYVNISVMERVDLGGYPNIMAAAQKRQFVDFLLPTFYEKMISGKKKVVVLVDEVDKADPSLWAPLLELTQFKSINGRKFENIAAFIMTGNLISEGGSRPSLPLLDRAEKYLVEADAQSWLNWSGKSGKIHPSITAYISDNQNDLFGAPDPEDRYADPSPRGWARASDILFKGEEKGWSSELLNKKVCGCVGKQAGIKYSMYYENYQQLLPMIEDIFNGQNIYSRYRDLPPSKKLVASMITCARLATQLDKAKAEKKALPKSVEHVGNFLSQVEFENILISVRAQITANRLMEHDLGEHPAWKNFIEDMTKTVSMQ